MTTPSSIEESMPRLEGTYEQINPRLRNLEGEVRALLTELNSRIDGLALRMDRLFLVVFGGFGWVNSRYHHSACRLRCWATGV